MQDRFCQSIQRRLVIYREFTARLLARTSEAEINPTIICQYQCAESPHLTIPFCFGHVRILLEQLFDLIRTQILLLAECLRLAAIDSTMTRTDAA